MYVHPLALSRCRNVKNVSLCRNSQRLTVIRFFKMSGLKKSTVKQSVSLYVSDDGIPSPSQLAKKYQVEEEKYNSDTDDDTPAAPEKPVFTIADLSGGAELAQRAEGLIAKVDEKNREIERLCFLLEALEPVPGLDAEKFLKLYDDNSDLIADYRDTKIVSLAKKCRKLTVALNKERSFAATSKERIDDLTKQNERLQKELDLVSSPAARAAAARSARSDQSSSGGSGSDAQLTYVTLKSRITHVLSGEHLIMLQRTAKSAECCDETGRGLAQETCCFPR